MEKNQKTRSNLERVFIFDLLIIKFMDTTKKKVLIIDDDPQITDALREKFETSGFESMVAHDGETGLKMALESHPDFLVLDLIMPKMDGLEMLEKLRADHWGGNAPVMILTNANDSDKLAKALEIGVDEYKMKSDVKMEDIVDRAKILMGVV